MSAIYIGICNYPRFHLTPESVFPYCNLLAIFLTIQEEDLNNPMDTGRRKHALERKREKLARIIQGERKAKTGQFFS